MFKSYYSRIAILIGFTLSMLSCNNQGFFEKKKEKYLIVSKMDKWRLNGRIKNEDKIGVDSNGDFIFIVKERLYTDGDDTINLSNYDYLGEKEKGYLSYYPILYIDKTVSVAQIEKFLKLNEFYHHSLREKLYWLCVLSHATLFENQNNYGDITGYTAKYKNEIIPSEYFEVRKSSSDYDNNSELKIFPKTLVFASESNNDSKIEISILLLKPLENINPHIGYDHNKDNPFVKFYTTEVTLENSDISFRPKNGYGIRLEINVDCDLGISKEKGGKSFKYIYHPQYFPYNVERIEK